MKWFKNVLAGLLIVGTLMLDACNFNNQPLGAIVVSPSEISPNADGVNDIARISYMVYRPTQVTIYLTDTNGHRYNLRDKVDRSPSPVPYEILFSGVVNGHLLPNGTYIWHIEATGTNDLQIANGTLRIVDGDTSFPKIQELTLSTNYFSPNQDGIADRVAINVVIAKKSQLDVYVIGQDGVRYEVQRTEGQRVISADGELDAGRYSYDYDGGIDLGAIPPPDGLYTLYAQTQDRIGQSDIVTASLTITNSGIPEAEIVIQPDGNSVEWSAHGENIVRSSTEQNFITMGISDTLYFTMAVVNRGTVPIRTAGPFDPNDCFTMSQNRYTKGYAQEPGAFRVGIDYETNAGGDNPWRYGLGTLADLDVVMNNGVKLYYLAPGKQVLVRGCIQMTEIPVRNPFSVYASLIHEDVEIVPINSQVSPVLIYLVKP